MDFMTLLSVAQNNKSSNQAAAYYPTKFTPPKKENKQSKDLSQNIKKFLSRKEEEEKRKAIEENKKKQNLLALRDEKAQKRINKHLKACKDANKSVLEDAIDNKNTSLTMPGTSQIVTDDYGYVSQEASALYDKLMNKYNSMPAEKPLFSSSGKKTVKDIESTKARVKEALKQEKFEESRGHRRKIKTSENSQEDEEESVSQVSEEEKKDEKERNREKLKSKKKAVPPRMNFAQLLKLAEQKQHEPIIVKVIPKKKEPEKLMTRKEYIKEKEWLEKKEDRRRSSDSISVKKTSAVSSDKLDKKMGSKAEILNGIKNISTEKDPKFKSPETVKKSAPRSGECYSSRSKNIEKTSKDKGKDNKDKYKEELLEERRKLEMERRKLEEMRRSIEEDKKKLNAAKEKSKIEQKISNYQSTKVVNKIGNTSCRESDKGNIKSGKDKILVKHKKYTITKKPIPAKRRAVFDDDEDEYDSELDGFIADEPEEEEEEDISKYISEIFGYDKSKYRYIDEDDSAMESNFEQQLKEEFISTKTGIMEDLEDIRKEANEKKRKAMLKKKRKS